MRTVERRFTQVFPETADDERLSGPISAFFRKSAVVILGEPGAGKTTSLQSAALAEPKAQFASIREFLTLSLSRWRKKTLYLDGLDEQRARTEDGYEVLDKIVSRLDELGCPPFRISCRAADWYGEIDQSLLSKVSQDNQVAVLRLDPLDEKQIIVAIADEIEKPTLFVEIAKQRGVYDLLSNPQSLSLIVKVVAKGTWPETRCELYSRACDLLVQEHNDTHQRAAEPKANSAEVRSAAGQLCAIQLCAGKAGFALVRTRETPDFPAIDRLSENRTFLSLAARRKIFRSEPAEKIIPTHRTVAEFMAAEHLAKRVKNGLPVARVLSLLSGSDGGTLSDLRGLYGWFACVCKEHQETLIRRDPLAVILYGDAATLPLTIKKLTLQALNDLSKTNPWFRSEDRSAQPFGALCSDDIVPTFAQILDDANAEPMLVSCVLDAITNGKPLPSLGDRLLTVVRESFRPNSIRSQALAAFLNVRPDDQGALERLLGAMHLGQIDDGQRRLRGALLKALYPSKLSPKDAVSYLVDDSPSIITEYHLFVGHELVQRTARENLPKLIDAVIASGLPAMRHDGFLRWRFLGQLIASCIEKCGSASQAEQLYNWLGAALDEYGFGRLHKEEAERIKKWFLSHPESICAIFDYWVSIVGAENIWSESRTVSARLQGTPMPVGFGQHLIELAAQASDPRVKDFLFREAVRLRTNLHRDDAPTLDHLFEFSERHTEFQAALESEMFCEIADWRWEQIRRGEKNRAEQEARRKKNIEILTPDVENIRLGSSRYLPFLAKLYFGIIIGEDHTTDPDRRLEEETDATIAKYAKEGFIRSLTRRDLPSARNAGSLYAKAKLYEVGYPVLAGVQILLATNPERVLKLPAEVLQRAIAFYHANVTGWKSEWIANLAIQRPTVVGRALESFWDPQFKAALEHVQGIFDLAADEYKKVARVMCAPLLEKYPECATQLLRTLLVAAVNNTGTKRLRKVVAKALSNRKVGYPQRLFWLATGYFLEPTKYGCALAQYASKRPERVSAVLDFLVPGYPTGYQALPPISESMMDYLIRLGGAIFEPRHRDIEAEASAREAAEAIASLLNRIGNIASPGASQILQNLSEESALAKWRNDILHAAASQRRKRRDAEFRYVDTDQVIKTLNGGAPSNAADLQALVLEHLRQISEGIRHGLGNAYKEFWNVDKYKRVTDPRPEEECRDRLFGMLRPKLLQVGVITEPEGTYAEDKQVDIKISYGPLNLPIEIKRHGHRDLWRAPMAQLKKLYMRDPGTGGRGVYCVLWFGLKKMRLPKPPRDVAPPRRPADLEEVLRSLIPKQDRSSLEIIVIDCSAP